MTDSTELTSAAGLPDGAGPSDGADLPDGAGLLDPELTPFAAFIPELDLAGSDLAEARAGFGAMIASLTQLSDLVERTEHTIPNSPDPDQPVAVRVHRAKNTTGTLPAIVSIHGGGYVVGSCDMDDGTFDRLCPMLECVGVSVEYRLSPETPYPGPLDDCYAALLWTFEHAEELGIDPTRIGIAGMSAGGGLAAALAILARDRGEVDVAFQLLECPMLDDRQVTSSSQLDRLLVWSAASNAFGWRSYLGDLYGAGAFDGTAGSGGSAGSAGAVPDGAVSDGAGSDGTGGAGGAGTGGAGAGAIPGTAAAWREADLTGLPPAYIAVGGADGFRDEDIAYALRLNQAGVPTELHVYPGVPHGVTMFMGTSWAQRWQRDVDDWLRRQLHP